MLGPKTENAISDGDGNVQMGHNSGTVTIGLTFEQHQAALERALASKEHDLARVHTAERGLLQAEIDQVRREMADLGSSYQAKLRELAETKALLARFDNQIDKQKLDAANTAIDAGETVLAQALLKELAAKARNRREDASKEEAELEFRLGEIAETEIRWQDAATHYATAARLNPSFDMLYKARLFAWRAGNTAAAFRFGEDLLAIARHDPDQTKLATALNEHALTLQAQGRYAEAKALYIQALEIDRKTIGEAHPDFGRHLNNLASVMHYQGLHEEAELLSIRANEIGRKTIGEAHPDFATHLNNLASVVRAQGRHAEAEALLKRSLDIGRKTIGESHPEYASCLNNLAGVVKEQGHYADAEELYSQALEIDRKTIGEAHPDFAIHLNNLAEVVRAQGRYGEADPLYAQALAILRKTLGDHHPNTRTAVSNYAFFLQHHRPDAAELPNLLRLAAG